MAGLCAVIYPLIADFWLYLFLSSLKEAFFHLLNTGSGHSDLQLRNDLLVITTLIAESPGSQLIVSTGQFNE